MVDYRNSDSIILLDILNMYSAKCLITVAKIKDP